ncbi:MAG: ribonuclease III [Oscillospiraceae bacterium]|nr:ribonuclease III [Oscillospiraceae bacterium]
MTEIEQKIGYTFSDKTLLQTALTHSSYANEAKQGKNRCNERLEFLGDSVLGFTVAKYLYKHYPDMPEGKMTKLRAELVCEQTLVGIADKLGLGVYLYLGRGEEQGGGRGRPSILADAVEAIFAAVLLDSDIAQAEQIVLGLLGDSLKLEQGGAVQDYKTALQELVQQKSGQVLSYHLLSATGPDHQKTFEAEVRLNDVPVGIGTGRSKKEAEQVAAAVALGQLYN